MSFLIDILTYYCYLYAIKGLIMSRFVIYIKLPKYLSQFIRHHLGCPVVFPQSSNENAIIRTFIQRLPTGMKPEMDDGAMTPVVIPDSVAKPPETYNYMGTRGKAAVAQAIKDLFLRALWTDISPLKESSVGLNALIAAWCEAHGIEIDQVETVRQCFYRIRKEYRKHGINIKKVR